MRQQLHLDCDIGAVRAYVQAQHASLVHRDYLELQHHWRDVILGFAHVIGEEFLPSTYKIVCVDATFIGNGDVEGNGARTLYIARQSANHFVPLLNAAPVDEGGPIFRGSSSGNKSGTDATKGSASRQSSAKAAVDLNSHGFTEAATCSSSEASQGEASDVEGNGPGDKSVSDATKAVDSLQSLAKSAVDLNSKAFTEAVSCGSSEATQGEATPQKAFSARRSLATARAAAAVWTNKASTGASSSNSSAASQDEASEDEAASSAYDSDASDLFHLEVETAATWETPQDKDRRVAHLLAAQMRRHPLVPSQPNDETASTSFTAVQSGLKLPVAHCAFRGCCWIGFTKDSIQEHVVQVHGAQLLAAEAEVYGAGLQYGSSPLLRKIHYTLNMHCHPFSWLAICGGRKLAIGNSNHEGCCLALISPATVVRGFS